MIDRTNIPDLREMIRQCSHKGVILIQANLSDKRWPRPYRRTVVWHKGIPMVRLYNHWHEIMGFSIYNDLAGIQLRKPVVIFDTVERQKY